jgi:hypothetical protein
MFNLLVRALVTSGARRLLGRSLRMATALAITRYRKHLSPDTDPLEDMETRFERAVTLIRQDIHKRGESLAPDLVRRLAPYEDATVEAVRAWVRRNAQKLAEATDSSEELGDSGRAWRRAK